MRNVRNAIIIVLIPIAEFIVIDRLGLLGGPAAVLIFFTMIPLLIWAVKQDTGANELRLQKAAASFGFQPADRDEVSFPIYPLRQPGWVNCAACGELRGLQAWIFDYTVSDQGASQTRRNLSQTVMGFSVDGANLPVFQIRPLDWSTSVLDSFDSNNWKHYDGDWERSDQTICFPDATGFHRLFELVSTAEEGVRRHFNARLLNTVAALNECNYVVKGYYTTVLIFAPGTLLRQPDEMEAFARKGADIAYALFSAEKSVMAAAGK